jgi:uncharacterized protein
VTSTPHAEAALAVLRVLGGRPMLVYVASAGARLVAAFWTLEIASAWRRARADLELALVSVSSRGEAPLAEGTPHPIDQVLDALGRAPDAPRSIALAVSWNEAWDDGKCRVWIDALDEEIVWWGAFHPQRDHEYEERQSFEDFAARGPRGCPEKVPAEVEASLRAHLATVPPRMHDGPEALVRAAARGDEALVRDLLARGVDPGSHDRRGKLALARALEGRHAGAATLLVHAGADPHRCLGGAAWCLYVATLASRWELVSALLDRGAVRADDLALAKAVALGAPVALLSRLAAGPRPSAAHPAWLDPAIRARADAEPAVAAWIAERVGPLPAPPPKPVHAPPAKRDTRLHAAVRGGDVAGVERLLAARAPVEERDSDDRTPLMRAAEAPAAAQAALIEKLLAAGARHDATDRMGATALVKAVRRGATAAVEALCAGGADPNAIDEHTPVLVWAARNADAATVAILLAAGADRSRRDDRDLTALDHALRKKATDCIALLRAP